MLATGNVADDANPANQRVNRYLPPCGSSINKIEPSMRQSIFKGTLHNQSVEELQNSCLSLLKADTSTKLYTLDMHSWNIYSQSCRSLSKTGLSTLMRYKASLFPVARILGPGLFDLMMRYVDSKRHIPLINRRRELT